MAKEITPDTPSAGYTFMLPDWQLIRTLRAGARSVREAGDLYLPKFEDEDNEEYQRRVKSAPFSAHYEDAVRTLAAKPFSKEVKLQGDVPTDIIAWAENIDNAGHNLHVVARSVFDEALHIGLCFIYVDHTPTGDAPSLGAERRLGARPYFRIIPADEMLAVYTGIRGGQTYIRQIRFRDNETVIDGLEEKVVERVRQIDDVDEQVTATLYTKGTEGWTAEAPVVITGKNLKTIPVVPIVFGLPLSGPFSVKPPMVDLAHKQIEHYQHASRLANIFDYAGFPMFQAKGMGPMLVRADTWTPENPLMVPARIKVGPRSVLYATPGQAGDKPEWGFIEPSAQTIKEVREHLKDLETEMRTLGLQPQMPRIGVQNMAATTSAIGAARAHSTLQSWALALKDGLEQAFVYMAQWVGLPETAECDVYTDFSAEVLNDADEKILLEARISGQISWETWADEMQRRDLLGPAFDKESEREKIANDDPLGMGTGAE